MAGMASVPAHSLECAICQELYNDPKQLSCTHTFCQKCLADLFDFNIKQDRLVCPVCRQTTQVENGDVSKLQTNFPIKSLVEEIKAAEKVCTANDHELRSPALGYCQTCGVYMCSICLDFHGKWKSNAGHEVVDSKAIKSGKVKVKQLCKKHPQEKLEWACSTCKVSICFRCRMLYHNGPGHEVEEVAVFQKALQDEAKALKKEAQDKMMLIKDHIKLVEEENMKTCSILDEREADVVKAFDESVEKLTKQKDELIKKLQKCKEEMTGNLLELQASDWKLLNGISSTCDLMDKRVTGVLEGESLVVHQRLCKEVRELVGRAGCNDENPRAITERAECIKFTRHCDQQELKLGEINLPEEDIKAASANRPRRLKPTLEEKQWHLEKINSFSLRGAGFADMASGPDGKIAVGYKRGGIDMFTADGLHDKVLDETCISSLSVLKDGRYAILKSDYNVCLYSSQFKQILAKQFTVSKRFTVGAKSNDIVVFTHDQMTLYRSDGKKLDYITYQNFLTPDLARQTNHGAMLVLGYQSSIQVVKKQPDGKWMCIYEVEVEGSKPCPVVLEDDSILVGCVKNGYATVELYTKDLRFVRTVLQGFKLQGKDFIMSRFSTGEIAMCDSRYMYIFCIS